MAYYISSTIRQFQFPLQPDILVILIKQPTHFPRIELEKSEPTKMHTPKSKATPVSEKPYKQPCADDTY